MKTMNVYDNLIAISKQYNEIKIKNEIYNINF